MGSFPSYVAAMMVLRDGRLDRLKRKLAASAPAQQVRTGPERLAEERWEGEGGNFQGLAGRRGEHDTRAR